MAKKVEYKYISHKRLHTPSWKLEEVKEDIANGRLSHTNEPVLCQHVSNGKYLVIDGNHRVLESAISGQNEIYCKVDTVASYMTASELAQTNSWRM